MPFVCASKPALRQSWSAWLAINGGLQDQDHDHAQKADRKIGSLQKGGQVVEVVHFAVFKWGYRDFTDTYNDGPWGQTGMPHESNTLAKRFAAIALWGVHKTMKNKVLSKLLN